MRAYLFNILREYNFRYRIACQDVYLSKFYSFIDHIEYISPREDFINLSKDCKNVNVDLNKSIQECKRKHNLIHA